MKLVSQELRLANPPPIYHNLHQSSDPAYLSENRGEPSYDMTPQCLLLPSVAQLFGIHGSLVLILITCHLHDYITHERISPVGTLITHLSTIPLQDILL